MLLGAAGCRSSDVFTGPDPLAGKPPLGHDVLTLQAVIAAEEQLIGLYRTAIGTDHVTASRSRTLGSLLGQHEQHLAQLKARLVVPPEASPSPSRPATTPRPGRVTTARLRAAEQASAASLVRQLAAVPPALAQLFASIAASDATHVTVLGGLATMAGNRTSAAAAAVSALQAALAAEDAAIFGYGVAGAHLSGSSQAAAGQDWTAHNQARDTLTGMISGRGAVPVAAQASYQLPFRVHDAATARSLAAYLEDGVTRAYLGLVAVSDQDLRTFGAMAMQESAQRATSWRGSTQAFPGLR